MVKTVTTTRVFRHKKKKTPKVPKAASGFEEEKVKKLPPQPKDGLNRAQRRALEFGRPVPANPAGRTGQSSKPDNAEAVQSSVKPAPRHTQKAESIKDSKSAIKSDPKSDRISSRKTGSGKFAHKKGEKSVTYGEKVKRRRLDAIAEMGDELSKSRKRKEVLKQEALFRNPAKAFDMDCGKLYNKVLQSTKDKQQLETEVGALIELLWSADHSPIVQLAAAAEPEEVDRIYSRPCIARAIQTVLKFGTEAQRRLIMARIGGRFSQLCQYPAGHHICVKLFRYLKEPQDRDQMLQSLYDRPRSFFTKYGCMTWDFIIGALGYKNKFKTPMLWKVFLERVLAADLKSMSMTECKTLSVEALLEHPDIKETTVDALRSHCIETIDQLVKKELLKSYLVQAFLAKIVTSPRLMATKDVTGLSETFANAEREDEAEEKTSPFSKLVSEAVFDGAHQLLLTKEGVLALSVLCGFWSAKDRKTFISNIRSELQLSQQDWSVYLENEIDCTFVVRLLETIDDTKLSGEQILGSIFKFKLGKDGFLKLQDPEAVIRILMNPRSCAMLVRLMKPDLCRSFMFQHELKLLDFAAPTSKKDPEMRREELVSRYLVPVLSEVEIAQCEVLKMIQDERHKKMLDIITSAVKEEK